MIASIIPITKLPSKAGTFDYLIPDNLTVQSGDLVLVPFRNKTIRGIVVAIKSFSPHKHLKQITQIVEPKFLSDYHLKLISWFADYYHVSPSTAASVFVPEKPKRNMLYKPFIPSEPLFAIANIPKIRKSRTFSKGAISQVLLSHQQQRHELLSGILHQSGQRVVIFPTFSALQQAYYAVPASLRQRILVISSQLNKTQYWHAWQTAQNTAIIFTTRIGVFFPFANDVTILLDQSEYYAYKQLDQNPRYSIWEVLKFMSNNKPHTTIIFSSQAPKIEHFTYTQSKHFILHDKQTKKYPITITDLGAQGLSDSPHPLLNKGLLAKIHQHKKSILLINHKGESVSIKCSSCAWYAICPLCNQVLQQSRQQLVCSNCTHTEALIHSCPNCRAQTLQKMGMGTKAIQAILQQQVPHEVVRIDHAVQEKPRKRNHLIIGTQLVLDLIDMRQYDMVVALLADIELTQTDFRSRERAYQFLSSIFSANRTQEKVLQTYQPEHELWSYVHKPYQNFWKSEIIARKKYTYPPFTKLLRLLYAHSDEHKVTATANKMYSKLAHDQALQSLTIGAPRQSRPYKLHRRYYQYILVKYIQEIPKQLFEYDLKDWILDFDPEQL